MTIQFSEWEIETIRHYFNRVDSRETQKQLAGLHQEFPEWNTVFLLLRKLLAYGVNCTVPTDQEISYEALQTKSQKSHDMLVALHTYFGLFQKLLTTCVTQQGA